MDNIIRVNPACREPLTVEQQEIFIDYIYGSENMVGWQTYLLFCLARECGLEKPLD